MEPLGENYKTERKSLKLTKSAHQFTPQKGLNAKMNYAGRSQLKHELDNPLENKLSKNAFNNYNSTNQFQKNVKDYLLPEIRALEDKNDVHSLKKAMEFDKV